MPSSMPCLPLHRGEYYYLDKTCKILREYYRLGGAGFYAINIPPMALIVEMLEQSAHEDSHKLLAEMKSYFLDHCDYIVSRGENYPPGTR